MLLTTKSGNGAGEEGVVAPGSRLDDDGREAGWLTGWMLTSHTMASSPLDQKFKGDQSFAFSNQSRNSLRVSAHLVFLPYANLFAVHSLFLFLPVHSLCAQHCCRCPPPSKPAINNAPTPSLIPIEPSKVW